ncbi:cupin domain-containing protein [uncultured Jatrophihabitans sp.]|uniref:cupin domain-containing protein n=1 Tax=uncultured Jatrophihabitans sp. TaxID=1610747 RepID=UPI0035CA49D0
MSNSTPTGMRVTWFSEATPFAPPDHHAVRALLLRGGDAFRGESMVIGLSHYLPGGEAETEPEPADTAYVVVNGELAIIGNDVEKTLRSFDSAFLPAGAHRRVINRTNVPASMLVIRPEIDVREG